MSESPHDPMCPTQTMCKCKDQECWDCRDVVLCQCELIARVRTDAVQGERKRLELELHRLDSARVHWYADPWALQSDSASWLVIKLHDATGLLYPRESA